MFKQILVPVRQSGASEDVLEVVGELLRAGAAEAVLLLVAVAPRATPRRRSGIRPRVPVVAPTGYLVGKGLPAAPPAYAETKDQAVERGKHELEEYLQLLARPLRRTGRCVRCVVHFGEPAEQIIAFARQGRFDVIVMASRRRPPHRPIVQPSVATQVVRSGVAPVLLIPPKSGSNEPTP